MKPTVVWITGLSGAGKTTVANALYETTKEKYKTLLLDGDVLRLLLDKPLGFDIQSRERMVNETVYKAMNAVIHQNYELIIVSMISPLRSMRDQAKHMLTKYASARFIEVFMDTPLKICEERDPKGLYKKARAGEIKDFSGIDSPYEVPEFPEIQIHPRSTAYGKMTIERAANIILDRIQQQEFFS
jgi:adenylyl-sulfate kinase